MDVHPLAASAVDSGRGLARADVGRLAVLLLLAALLHGWLIAHTEVLARDGTGFVRYALELERRPWRDVLADSHQHPLYPLTVLAVSLPVRSLFGTTCETMRVSAQLAAAVPGILLVVPMYYFGRALFDRRVGFWGAALFQCLPVTARITADALSDPLCLFLVATALWLGVRALRSASVKCFAVCGLCSGLAYLVRPEGIVPPAVVGLVLLGTQASKKWCWGWRRFSACAASLVAAALIVGGPYAVLTGHFSNKPAARGILQGAGKIRRNCSETGPSAGDAWARACLAGPSSASASGGEKPLHSSLWPGAEGQGRELSQGLWALATTTIRDFQYLGWLPALFGAWWFRDRLRRQPEAWVLPVLCVVFGAVLVRLRTVAGYLSERHVQVLVLCGCFWAASAVATVGDWLAVRTGRRWAATALLAILTGFGLPVLARPLHANQAGYRTAGLWLAAHTQPDDEIIDPRNITSYYAGRLFPKSATWAPGSVPYVVVEEPQRAEIPAEMRPLVETLMRYGTVVFRCPVEAGRGKGQEVVIYAGRPIPATTPGP